MYKALRIIFCILAVCCAAACIFVFIYADNIVWGIAVVALGFVFGGLMVTFKILQENKERRENPPPPKGDFISGKVEKNNDEGTTD